MYFSVYEMVKQVLANARGLDSNDRGASMTAGGLCGIASWIFVRPFSSRSIQFLSLTPLPDLSYRCQEDPVPEALSLRRVAGGNCKEQDTVLQFSWISWYVIRHLFSHC